MPSWIGGITLFLNSYTKPLLYAPEKVGVNKK
jgi:hypothetical protein